jgi:hypothetical protein
VSFSLFSQISQLSNSIFLKKISQISQISAKRDRRGPQVIKSIQAGVEQKKVDCQEFPARSTTISRTGKI